MTFFIKNISLFFNKQEALFTKQLIKLWVFLFVFLGNDYVITKTVEIFFSRFVEVSMSRVQ